MSPAAREVWSPNLWTAREVPGGLLTHKAQERTVQRMLLFSTIPPQCKKKIRGQHLKDNTRHLIGVKMQK